MSNSVEKKSERSETTRVEAFSDGVFAIAITLLVLELKVPHDAPDGTLLLALAKLWPSYLAFLASFLAVGVMWINHHRLFTLIVRSDQWLLVLNGLLLLGVTVVPFPTAVVATFLDRHDALVGALLYNGTFVLIAIVFNLLWRYASEGNRLFDGVWNPRMVNGIHHQYKYGPLFYLAVGALAFVSVPLSLILDVALAVFFVLPGERLLLGAQE